MTPSPPAADLARDTSAQRYFYSAYGLRLVCDFELGELNETAPGPFDLEVRFAPVARRGAEESDVSIVDFSGADVYFGWPRFARFLIRSPALIEVELEPEGPATLLALPLLGPILALLLYKRGYIVLHGSAVSLDGQGVMFLGDKEAGKSTTAAAMLAAGCELVSDDVVAIDLNHSPPTILTAYPSLKLTETASAHFAPKDAARLDRPFEDFPKDRFRLGRAFRDEDTPARLVYILERTPGEIAAEPLHGRDALSALLRFSYLARFGEDLLHGAEAVRHFQQCAKLSRAIGVRRLLVPNSLERVSQVPGVVAEALKAEA